MRSLSTTTGANDMWPFHRHARDEPRFGQREDAVQARIVLARLESQLDRQDSVYEQLARGLGIKPNGREG